MIIHNENGDPDDNNDYGERKCLMLKPACTWIHD